VATETSTARREGADGGNAEAIEAWDGPLYERFVQFRHLLTTGLGRHGEQALAILAPRPGERGLDIGCGFGDTSQRIASLDAPDGDVLGVDASPRFIESASSEARQSAIGNLRFAVADVQATAFEETFDIAFSRMGTMFFASPVAAMRNVSRALVAGGRLAMVVWRRREDNHWVHRAQTVTERFVQRPEEYEEPTCGPGPFSMANADTTSDILLGAGFTDVTLRRCDLPIQIGRDLEEAVELAMSLGPAGEILRLAGDRAAHVREPVASALREAFAEWDGPDGVTAPASSWIVTARVPAQRRDTSSR
jgi:ubiquinone/menaquinone biosynthesis C-methylase UbiE